MKRFLLILVLPVLLSGLACSLLAPSSASPLTPSQPAPVLTLAPSAAETALPVLETAPASVTQPPSPATQPPQAAASPAASASPVNYTETFDNPNDAWTALQVVTSQSAGEEPPIKSKLENGRLRLSIQEKETYAYQFFKTPIDGNAAITATYEYRTLLNNGVALVCKADPGYSSWYEVRLLAPEGKYDIYQYDHSLKADNKNPYVLLGTGLLKPKEFSTAKLNTFSLTCTGNELRLDLNNGTRVITQAVTSKLVGNLSGIGAMSYNLVPVNIDFKTVIIQSQ